MRQVVFPLPSAVDLPYPNPSKGMEFFALFAFVALESSRLYFGSRGNKTESIPPLMIFHLLTVAAAFGYVYYMIWQTYVTYLDIPLNAIGLFFVGSELLFALHQIWKLSRTNAY